MKNKTIVLTKRSAHFGREEDAVMFSLLGNRSVTLSVPVGFSPPKETRKTYQVTLFGMGVQHEFFTYEKATALNVCRILVTRMPVSGACVTELTEKTVIVIAENNMDGTYTEVKRPGFTVRSEFMKTESDFLEGIFAKWNAVQAKNDSLIAKRLPKELSNMDAIKSKALDWMSQKIKNL